MSPRASLRPIALTVLGLSLLSLAACGGAEARKAKHLEKGRAYLEEGNTDKARVEFQNALQIAPVDPEARYENGVVDEKLGKVREAAQFYQGVLDVSPGHQAALTKLARLYLLGGGVDHALELIEPGLEKHPDDAELLTLRAAARVQKKDMTGGLADAERAVSLAPTNEDAYGTLAGIYVAGKQWDKAQALLEVGIAKIPTTVDLRMALVQVFAAQDRPADIERELVELVKLRPADKGHRIRLAQFYVRQNHNDAAERVLREGIKELPSDRDLKLSLVDFLAAHQTQEAAEKELKGFIAADAADPELKFALARFYKAQHHPEQAEQILQQIIDAEKLDAAGLSARDQLASLRAERNDVKGAEELIGQVLAKSPRDTEALVLRGSIELSRKDPKDAIADLRTVLRDQPNAVGVLRTLARAHMMNGEPAIAEETMQRAVEANPQDAALRLDYAQLLSQLGKAEQAKGVLVELVKERPTDVAALDVLFRVSAGLKDFDTAKSAADALVAAQPKSALGYLFQGMLAEAGKREEEAVRLYAKSADLQPDAIEPLQAQIRLLVAMKRTPEALKRLDEMTAAAPTVALAPYVKGELLLAQKDFAGAQAAYKTAIDRAPKWWMAYRGLALTQFGTRQADAALATLRDAETKVDSPDKLGMEIATYYEAAGKPQEAIREYEDVVRRDPQSEIAANNLAMLLVTYHDDRASLDRAKALTERFAESSNVSYLDTYGWVLYKRGEAAASVPVLQRVASKVPDAPVVLYHLGMAQSQAGDTAVAVGNLTRAVKSGQKFLGIDEAKATLDRLAKLPPRTASKT